MELTISKDNLCELEKNPPRLLSYLKRKNSEFYPQIIEVARDVEQVLNNMITTVFTEYTLHNINHSTRIMEYIYDLIDNVEEFVFVNINLSHSDHFKSEPLHYALLPYLGGNWEFSLLVVLIILFHTLPKAIRFSIK